MEDQTQRPAPYIRAVVVVVVVVAISHELIAILVLVV